MKTFFKIIFVVLVLANCGAFVILYPQYDSESTEAASAAKATVIESTGAKAARIALISEIKQPIPRVIKEPVPEPISEPVPADSPEVVDEIDEVEVVVPADVRVSAGSIE